MDNALEFLIYPSTDSSFTVYDGTTLNVQSNGTIITANLISAPRPIKLRFRAAPAAGVERDGVRLTTFTNVNGFVEVTFDHTGGATQIGFSPDTDGDGMTDSWEQYWFGGNVNPSDDADGDGLTNLQEYLAGTAPEDPSNFLRVVSTQLDAGNFIVSFDTVAGMKYALDTTDDLLASWTVLSNNITGPGGVIQIPDNVAGVTQRFYRARLLP